MSNKQIKKECQELIKSIYRAEIAIEGLLGIINYVYVKKSKSSCPFVTGELRRLEKDISKIELTSKELTTILKRICKTDFISRHIQDKLPDDLY